MMGSIWRTDFRVFGYCVSGNIGWLARDVAMIGGGVNNLLFGLMPTN